ncbi:conserved virulence factor C [Striga asiatica]|uniref:Conserved virulence factor C n=1 Tax=Striga asiatica TaxID=4170 RepID=A0A5A7QNV6_STRAF|nr:conserved virulence factor C [Striga asiatica]
MVSMSEFQFIPISRMYYLLDAQLRERLPQLYPDLRSKHQNLTIAKKLTSISNSFFKHGHGIGFMLGVYLDLVCTSMENIRMVPRPPFIFPGSVVSQAAVTGYPTADPIRKLRMYRVGEVVHAGRFILKEIVYAVNNIGNPVNQANSIALAGHALNLNEDFLVPQGSSSNTNGNN